MGLDIYAGPLTRYYAGDWQTVVQRYAAEQGIEVQIVRPGDAPPQAQAGFLGRIFAKLGLSSDPPPDSDQRPDNALVQELVQNLRDAIIDSLKDHLDGVEPWNESMEAQYDTDKPDWDGLGSLILWAAYDQCPDLSPPTKAMRDWHDDPAYARHYQALLRECHVWLPIEMPGTFKGPLPNEQVVEFGSAPVLLENLKSLNEATWRADLSDPSGSGLDQLPPPANAFEEAARFGFALLYRLTHFANQNRTPMILDY